MKNEKLVQATDEEVQQAIEEALDEMDDEIIEMFENPDEETIAFSEEWCKAETLEEKLAVEKKYKTGAYSENADLIII